MQHIKVLIKIEHCLIEENLEKIHYKRWGVNIEVWDYLLQTSLNINLDKIISYIQTWRFHFELLKRTVLV